MTQIPLLDGPSGAPASGGSPKSIVIFLHGYGSNGADLIDLAPYWAQALPDTLFLAPDAPQPCEGVPYGRQWWALTSLTPQARAAGVRVSARALDAYIDAQLTAHGLAEDKLALVGFSQGTMMALHVGPRRAKALAGIVGFSGMLADPEALAAEVVTKPPVLLVHGDRDDVLPLSALHQADVGLKALGFEVATHVSPGLGHSIDEGGLRLGARFLIERLR
ncbi:alpha/beta hydrolase [Caulobacter hibisci]|uniref:Dienelactone hydrolase family protein n=1 Tax=Caulobacter hibisci TaxID=2035993 RepID=A0ABS0SXZ8_9CAUL|nr:dienelactone hydrolase family protein [Caulobacter hibisci]MBI1684506.1 dienelactone hydrolase family protein [Caulobacter hibisci]